MLATVCNKRDDRNLSLPQTALSQSTNHKHHVLLVKLQTDCHKIMHMSLKNLDFFFPLKTANYTQSNLCPGGPQDTSSTFHQHEQKSLPKRNSLSNPSGL